MDEQRKDPMKQRAHARYSIRLPVQLSAGERLIQGESRNLSIGGMFVETSEPIPYGTQLQVSFQIPTHNKEIKVNGLVCWVEKDGQTPVGVGLKFSALCAIEVWALNQLFAQQG